MREVISSVTRRGQVTIPATVRRHLGIGAPDKIAFVLNDDGSVNLKPVEFTVSSLTGIVPPLSRDHSVDFDEMIEQAMEEEADRIVGRMRRP